MSPSPKWCSPAETPLFEALAAAQHDAWLAPDADIGRGVFAERVRQLLGPDRADAVFVSAIHLFNMQPRAPEGFEAPPASAYIQICPRCQRVKRTKFTIPQNGRLKLVVLRDPDWLYQQFGRGRTCETIAKQLECTASLVVDWARKHGILTPRSAHTEEINAGVRSRHMAGECPGEIATALDIRVSDVRKIQMRLQLATQKQGQHYHKAEWWIERIVRRGWTTGQCARAAGLTRHGCAFWLKRFELQHITKARSAKKGARRVPKYPQLADAGQLAELLRTHESYASVARAIGCSPTLVSIWARDLLSAGKRHENIKPTSAKSWWTERLDRGLTMWELAEEAGVVEKSVREKLRVFDPALLAQGYRNNTAAERARRKAS